MIAGDLSVYEGVAKVYDGDGIYVILDDGTKVKIRLFGLDAPETSQPCFRSDGTQFLCGRLATANLERIVAGRVVSCRRRTVDRYKRKVAICHLGDQDIGELIVRQGYARAWPKYSIRYVRAEQSAIRQGEGLWSGEWQAPWEYRKVNR